MNRKIKLITLLLAMLCLSLLMFGCDGGGGGSDDDEDLTEDPYPTISVDTYIPDGYTSYTIAATYKTDADLEKVTIDGTEYVTKDVEFVIVFTNGEWVSSEKKIYINTSTNAIDSTKTEQEPDEAGHHTMTGESTSNCSGTITIESEWNGSTWVSASGSTSLTISNGSFTFEGDTYTIVN